MAAESPKREITVFLSVSESLPEVAIEPFNLNSSNTGMIKEETKPEASDPCKDNFGRH